MPVRWRRSVSTLACVLTLCVVVPACGGDGGTTAVGDSRPTTTAKPKNTTPTIPDLGLGKGGDCLKLAGTYAALAILVLRGGDAAKTAQAQVTAMKEQLPASLDDDVDVVAATYAKIADKGVAGATELQTPEYKAANQAIVDYLGKTCSGSMTEPGTGPMLGRPVSTSEYGRIDLFEVTAPVRVTFRTGELEALCPAVEGIQPDRYEAEISYVARTHAIESKSLKLWLVTFRDRRIFAEHLAVELHDTLAALGPAISDVRIRLTQNVRGGVVTVVEHPVD